MENYELNIISNHKDYDGKNMKQFDVEGIKTIGVFGDEPFTIQFKNNTWTPVQVKLSLDGVDILTGDKASTQHGRMWIVKGREELMLKAFPETNDGGSRFVFTHADKSVASHTIKDLSHRGIIAAAVYVEGDAGHTYYKSSNFDPLPDWHSPFIDIKPSPITYGPMWTSSKIGNLGLDTVYGQTHQSVDSALRSEKSIDSLCSTSGTLVAVGAGEYVEQKITNEKGLTKPMFTQSMRVRYLWWDELKDKLRMETAAQPHPSGFPGDKEVSNINLKNVPKTKSESPLEAMKNEYFGGRF